MTDIQHIDLDAPEYDGTPKALRDAYKALQDRYKTVIEERDTYKGQATAQALGDVLAGYKNPKRVERDLLSDSIDPLNREAVEKWLAENGDDYAKGEGAPAQAVTHEDAAAHQRLQQADLTSPADMTAFEAAKAEITADMDGEAIQAVYRKHGL